MKKSNKEGVPSFRISDLVLYKDNQIIALSKPPAIPVQRDKSGDKSLIDLGEIYCKKHLFLLHRLDRPASGVVLFAKNKKAASSLSEQFKNRKIQKTYLAVTKNAPPEKSGTLVHFLKKSSSNNKAIVFEKEEEGTQKAILHYKVVGKSDNYFMLEINPETGRFHQIRAQLAAIGSPIKGDVKYGARRSNKGRFIHLHAWKMCFVHPGSKEQIQLVAPPPEEVVWDAFSLSSAD